MRWDVGIDLGTESVRMAELKSGPTLEAAGGAGVSRRARVAGLRR